MPLNPSNPNITNAQTVELETTIADAVWSISGTGSLSAGPTAFKRIFTPAGNGVSMVKARSPYWETINAGLALDADKKRLLVTDQTASPRTAFMKSRLNSQGDKASFIYDSAVAWYIFETGISKYRQIFNGIIYGNGGTQEGNFVANNGDLMDFEIGAAGAILLKKNGVTIHTFAVARDGSPMHLALQVQAGSQGHYITADQTGSGISGITEENATVTVSAALPSPPSDVILGAVTNSGAGVSIAFTPATDDGTVASLSFYRSIDNFATFATIPNVPNISPFLDTTAPRGQAVKYVAKAVDNDGTLSTNNSNPVAGQRWNLAPTITSGANLGNIQINQAIQITINAEGGDGTRIISAVGALPSGVSLAGNAVTINRSITGAFNFELRVKDDNNQTTTKTFNGTIYDPNAVPPVAAFSIPTYAQKGTDFQTRNSSQNATSFVWYKKLLGLGNFEQFSTAAEPTTNFAVVGTYQIKLKAINAHGETEIVKNINITDLAVISFQHRRPLDEEFIQTLTIDENLDLEEDVSEDEPLRSNFNISSLYVGGVRKQELWDFLYAHRNRQDFLWHNPDTDETLTVKLIKLSGARHMLSHGEYDVVIQYTHDV